MGLKQENFVDRVYITTTATGAAKTGLSPSCTFIDESGNRTAGTVAEMSNGWYKITDFTPDADGTWCTEWAVAGAYTIHYPFKEFKVGGGQEADILADTNELQTDWTNGGRLDLLVDAIKAKTDNLPADPADDSDIDSQLSTIDTVVDAIKAKTDNLPADPADDSDIDGQLSTIDTVVDAIKVVTDALPDAGALTTIDTNVDDIETDTADMQPRVPRITCHMDFWSNLQEEAQLGAGDESGVIALPDVVVADLPTGCTIVRAIAMFLCRSIENTNASANAVDVATGHIEVRDDTPGSWMTAIDVPDNSFGVAGSTREMGTVIIGDNDISGEVDGNDTYNFEFDDIGTDQDYLNFNDVQTGLRIYFTV